MAKDEVLTVKKAVHKLQLALLEGIKHENQLSAAASLMSRSDYEEVVTERTIAKMCGYPLCTNELPSERPYKGRYHVSLKKHTVYDLTETYKYCSSSCLINSRTFAGSMPDERSSITNPVKLNGILKLFDELSFDSIVDINKNEKLGISKLEIHERTDIEVGKVPSEEWIGPSNAIDGYVPRRDRNFKSPEKSVVQKQAEFKPGTAQPDLIDILCDEMNFTTITDEEYSVSKPAPSVKPKKSIGKATIKSKNDHRDSKPGIPQADLIDIMCDEMNFTIITEDEYSVSRTAPGMKAKESKGKVPTKGKNDHGEANSHDTLPKKSNKFKKNVSTTNKKLHLSDVPSSKTDSKRNAIGVSETCLAPEDSTVLKSSLKNSLSKKANRSVSWADGDGPKDLCEYAESGDPSTDIKVSEEESFRFVSVEACAKGLSQAAEDVASGKSHVSDALSEAGLTILPSSEEIDLSKFPQSGEVMDMDTPDTDPVLLKWPPKPGFSDSDLLESADSLLDSPPEGFNLSLSPFSTMFMALFSWLSSSSIAYIYGKDESFHEKYLCVNGKEYPSKIVALEGRSSEIKQTLAGCLSRALPGLVAELKLSTPISTLEQGMGRLVDTMSFIDPLPAFRMKEWQLIVLLFLDALSVSRIPALTQHMSGKRIWLSKVVEAARISAEEFEILKDLIIPLGQAHQISPE